jgi:hypothetical protein
MDWGDGFKGRQFTAEVAGLRPDNRLNQSATDSGIPTSILAKCSPL